MNNYSLEDAKTTKSSGSGSNLNKFWPLIKDEKLMMAIALFAILANSGLQIIIPSIIGETVDKYILANNFGGVVRNSFLLLAIFVGALVAGIVQTRIMGGVAQRVLFKLRNVIFSKLQELPVAFFNQNKAGDLISRINNDTDKLNQFFSQGLMQFVGNIFVIIGAGIAVLSLDLKLGLAALAPAAVLLVMTRFLSPWVKRRNAKSLETTGGLSANIQESLENFKVIVAFNRRDYFKNRLKESNDNNYHAAVSAGIANTTFTPFYGFFTMIAQLVVLGYGTYLITHGEVTLGLIVSFLTYVSRFYDPLRHMAMIWSSFQLALASWDRISVILAMSSDLPVIAATDAELNSPLLQFRNVRFGYPNGKEVLHKINFSLEAGKTYALVGPTGGGKTTTASLMSRLYDPTEGTVLLHGKDLQSYSSEDRVKKIGVILQEPFLFTGTVRDNILYGNDELAHLTNDELMALLTKEQLDTLIVRFEKGLETPVAASGDATSLGQRQLIAFIRAALRRPELLILDEATANIDTVTEQLLQNILEKLPKETTRVIIAHRLNTIEKADEIFFVNSGEVVQAGSFDHALDLLMHGKRQS